VEDTFSSSGVQFDSLFSPPKTLQSRIKRVNGGDGSGDRSTGGDGDDKFIEVH
jgi:hypothetical protein